MPVCRSDLVCAAKVSFSLCCCIGAVALRSGATCRRAVVELQSRRSQRDRGSDGREHAEGDAQARRLRDPADERRPDEQADIADRVTVATAVPASGRRPAKPNTIGAFSEMPAPASASPTSPTGAFGAAATTVHPTAASTAPHPSSTRSESRAAAWPKNRPSAIEPPKTPGPSPLIAGRACNCRSRKSALQLSIPPSTTNAPRRRRRSSRSPRAKRKPLPARRANARPVGGRRRAP